LSYIRFRLAGVLLYGFMHYLELISFVHPGRKPRAVACLDF